MAKRDDDRAKRVLGALGLAIFVVALLAFLAGPQRLWEGFFSTPGTSEPGRPAQPPPR